MSLDKRFEKYGFVKVREDTHGVTYKKEETLYGYVACLDIMHKQSGRHLLHSYDTKVIRNADGKKHEYFNPANGIEIRMLPLIFAKYIYMKLKYKW